MYLILSIYNKYSIIFIYCIYIYIYIYIYIIYIYIYIYIYNIVIKAYTGVRMDNEQEIQCPTDTNRYKNVLLVFIFNNNKYEFNI